MGNPPKRAYPDWMSLTPERFHETIYHGDGSWYFYYNMDWESCLMYGIILHNKDYQIEGGAPAWFTDYVENYVITPFHCTDEDITGGRCSPYLRCRNMGPSREGDNR